MLLSRLMVVVLRRTLPLGVLAYVQAPGVYSTAAHAALLSSARRCCWEALACAPALPPLRLLP